MEFSSYFQFVAALIFVLGMIGAATLLARRFVPGARNVNRRGQKRRLAIVEVIPVDTKRRLVLLRRDDTEHLVILGPSGDVVIERNIGSHFTELLGDGVIESASAKDTNSDAIQNTAPNSPGISSPNGGA